MYGEAAMTTDEVREWVRGRLVFEAWLRSLHAARDERADEDEHHPGVRPIRSDDRPAAA